MELAIGTTVHGFAIEKREDLPEIDGIAYIGKHEKSGARLLFLANDDNNKSFAIGFTTPPNDDTGVFHILEHSVLCGSRRFPVKEPFVDLLKGSMQTFLNAMTFGDKTLYPVASTNEQDLFNLMDVYLDAVFHPNIYVKRQIFEQEGWHYELHAIDGSDADPAQLPADQTVLVHNGVVFNEMKGALSDASAVLYHELQKALLPGTCYAFESGGTPRAIPTLTYEQFLDEHRRHYRTDNSYIILYGNLDAERALAFLDERYLVPVAIEQREADAERESAGLKPLRPRIITTADDSVPGDVTLTMPQLCERCGGSKNDEVTVRVPADSKAAKHFEGSHGKAAHSAPYIRKTMDTAPENACAACGYVVGDSLNRMRTIAIEILLDALFGSNEAPLTRALLDAGIAHDVNAFLSDAVRQPFAVVQVNMPIDDGGERLAGAIEESVRTLLETGLDKPLVEAALSHAEFVLREHDLGYADGVIYAMTALSSWLYDDKAPLDYLRYEYAFSELRRALEGDYFERLCAELFLDNTHAASVEIVPAPGVSDDDSAERLAAMNQKLDPEERKLIVATEELLRELQEAPDPPEAIASLPRLTLSDIGEAPVEPAYGIDEKAPAACLRHSVPTRGIAYAYHYFDMNGLSFDELPYVSVLALVLGKLGTAHRTAAEIDTLVQGKLGNLAFFTSIFEEGTDIEAVYPRFTVSSSALSENTRWLAELPREIMLETDFADTARILDLLKQHKIAMEQGFSNSGQSCAATRVRSYCTRAGVVREKLANVDFYRFLCDLVEQFDERADALTTKLADVASRLFCDDSNLISFAGSDADYDAFWSYLAARGGRRDASGSTRAGDRLLVIPEPKLAREAFVVPSDVCFASLGWDRRLLGDPHTGSWAVASRALSLDYLWNEVRVKGGAYGVGFKELLKGDIYFHSYRDPHLDETIERFEKAASWLAGFDPSREDIEGYIVASVASFDAPLKPRALVRRQASDYFTHRTPESRIANRRQVIETDVQTVRDLADVVRRAVEPHAMCVFGNREILEGSKAGFEIISLVG